MQGSSDPPQPPNSKRTLVQPSAASDNSSVKDQEREFARHAKEYRRSVEALLLGEYWQSSSGATSGAKGAAAGERKVKRRARSESPDSDHASGGGRQGPGNAKSARGDNHSSSLKSPSARTAYHHAKLARLHEDVVRGNCSPASTSAGILSYAGRGRAFRLASGVGPSGIGAAVVNAPPDGTFLYLCDSDDGKSSVLRLKVGRGSVYEWFAGAFPPLDLDALAAAAASEEFSCGGVPGDGDSGGMAVDAASSAGDDMPPPPASTDSNAPHVDTRPEAASPIGNDINISDNDEDDVDDGRAATERALPVSRARAAATSAGSTSSALQFDPSLFPAKLVVRLPVPATRPAAVRSGASRLTLSTDPPVFELAGANSRATLGEAAGSDNSGASHQLQQGNAPSDSSSVAATASGAADQPLSGTAPSSSRRASMDATGGAKIDRRTLALAKALEKHGYVLGDAVQALQESGRDVSLAAKLLVQRFGVPKAAAATGAAPAVQAQSTV